jgi:hypothetical protein
MTANISYEIAAFKAFLTKASEDYQRCVESINHEKKHNTGEYMNTVLENYDDINIIFYEELLNKNDIISLSNKCIADLESCKTIVQTQLDTITSIMQLTNNTKIGTLQDHTRRTIIENNIAIPPDDVAANYEMEKEYNGMKDIPDI